MSDTTRAAILQALASVAPEVDPGQLEDDLPLREQVDLDSVDFLNFLIAVSEALGVEVAEADYPKIETLADCVAYVEERAAGA